jgi:hypothetical protein
MATHRTTNALDPRFQVASLAVTIALIFYSLYSALSVFCAFDSKPTINVLTPQSFALISTRPAQVKVGLSIEDFSEFDVINNKFTFSGVLWFQCDPTIISLEALDKFSFERGTILYKSEPVTSLTKEGLFIRYSIRVQFKTDLSYVYFPLEDHKLTIVLSNNRVTTGEIIYTSALSDFRVGLDFTVSGWHYHGHNVQAGYGITTIGSNLAETSLFYPRVIFELEYLSKNIRSIITLILPLLLIFCLEMFSLCIDQREFRSTLISLSASNITALFAYRFVIENMCPKAGYLMFSDYIFFLFLGSSFTMFFVNGVGPYLTVRQKKMVSLSLQSCIALFFLISVKIWFRC